MKQKGNYGRGRSYKGGGRNTGYGNRNRRGGGRRGRKERIDPNKYVAEAQVNVEESMYVTDKSYAEFELLPVLSQNLAKKRYVHPTKVQSQAIPEVLAGRDILALASTGSGKTGAFLIPLINNSIKDKTQKTLIVVPTRELANQIKNEFDLFALNAGLKRVLVIGGQNIHRQAASIRENPQFIIGTPGRLKDLCGRGDLKLGQFNNVVLDEVDRMLDMGFIGDIKELIALLNPVRQSLFLSATMTPAAETIARDLLKEPVRITAGTQSPIKNVEQKVIRIVKGQNKIDTLVELLERREFVKVLVFSETKRNCDLLTRELVKRGIKVATIHGNKSQNVRTRMLASFRKNDIQVLVATDVASRGIDVPDITHVINYDEPNTYDDYIHRIGRTGRIGKRGVALTFVG